MFDSGKSTSDLIAELKYEVDAAPQIPDSQYIDWLSALEQLLYSDIIKEQRRVKVKPVKNKVDLSSITVAEGEDTVRYEDIYTVYNDDIQFIETTLNSGAIFEDSYFKENNQLSVYPSDPISSLEIVYFVRPARKTTAGSGNVMLPIEFLDLVKAKLRGEAYKLVNEDSLAAKWLNDYNVMLENFKIWVSEKQPKFGM